MFKDHFSEHAGDYARYRPDYPDALFGYLAGAAPGRRLAWDCATGSGQAAARLAAHFPVVIATDAAFAQVANAEMHPRVAYAVAYAEAAPLEPGSVDLVTVAQALHWFDTPAFYAEVRRVTKPGGACAAWGYGLMRIDPAIDAIVDHLYAEILGPYWPPERAHLDAGYRTLGFPFPELPVPPFSMEANWPLVRLLGYLVTWSAVKRYAEARGSDPLAPITNELARAWGSADTPRRIRWPLYLRLGRVG